MSTHGGAHDFSHIYCRGWHCPLSIGRKALDSEGLLPQCRGMRLAWVGGSGSVLIEAGRGGGGMGEPGKGDNI
ncbi:rCG61910 [Rattus norvegicus]|uniref:RCG61910 n=1 Tax=Rattus norvegicus TaxID=10116 RepID=A6HBE2_RAT|nr:rCG61910 [Rattus norvegicus]